MANGAGLANSSSCHAACSLRSFIGRVPISVPSNDSKRRPQLKRKRSLVGIFLSILIQRTDSSTFCLPLAFIADNEEEEYDSCTLLSSKRRGDAEGDYR